MMTDYNPAPVLLRDAASTVVADDPMMFDKVSVHNVAKGKQEKKAGPDCSTKGTVLSLYSLFHTPFPPSFFFPSPAHLPPPNRMIIFGNSLSFFYSLSILPCSCPLAPLLHFR